MTFVWTEEMKELWAFIEPWIEWRVKENAPQEIKDAEKRFLELYAYEEERQKMKENKDSKKRKRK